MPAGEQQEHVQSFAVGSVRGISVISLQDDVPVIDMAPGVAVRHIVGGQLLARRMELAPEAAVDLDGEAEHVVWVMDGRLEVTAGSRSWQIETDSVALMPAGVGGRLSARGGQACCQVTSTPPDVRLVRHLLHLEHADHGFD